MQDTKKKIHFVKRGGSAGSTGKMHPEIAKFFDAEDLEEEYGGLLPRSADRHTDTQTRRQTRTHTRADTRADIQAHTQAHTHTHGITLCSWFGIQHV